MHPGCNLSDSNLHVLDLTQLWSKGGTQASSIRVHGTKVERTTNCDPEGCFFGLKFTRTCDSQTNKETEFLIIFQTRSHQRGLLKILRQVRRAPPRIRAKGPKATILSTSLIQKRGADWNVMSNCSMILQNKVVRDVEGSSPLHI